MTFRQQTAGGIGDVTAAIGLSPSRTNFSASPLHIGQAPVRDQPVLREAVVQLDDVDIRWRDAGTLLGLLGRENVCESAPRSSMDVAT